LIAQPLGKLRRELLQFVRVFRLAEKSESQLASLGEVVVINLQTFHGRKTARKEIEHLGVEPKTSNQDGKANHGERAHRRPH